MTSLKKANRRVGSLFAVAALVLATVTPGLVPAFASAAQISERSVSLSSSSKTAEDVDYNIKFTADADSANAKAVVVNFCDSPLINSACNAVDGFAAGAAVTGDATTVADATTDTNDNTVVVTTTADITGGSDVDFTLSGITNPDEAGPLYVRIVTYDTTAHAMAYAPTVLGTGAIDTGSAAVSITDTVGVSGAVLESMTFCVSGAAIDPDCDAGSITAPSVELGDGAAGAKALATGKTNQGSIYTQISTNAASGAVVSLRSSADGCGGLVLSGHDEDCNIGPATATATGNANGIADLSTSNKALFGIKVTGSGVADADGELNAVTVSKYNSSAFLLNYNDTTSGVTSPYGDPVLDTAGAPANNKNASITFGASITNNTPAGRYSADFSLIATGKF